MTAAVMFVWAVGLLGADEASPDTSRFLPEMPRATLQMPWTDLKDLLTALDAAVDVYGEKSQEAAKPPVPWTVSEAHYEAEALGGSAVRIDATMQIHVWEPEEWVQIPVVGDTVAPTAVTLDGEPAALAASDAGLLLLPMQGAGVHTLLLTFFVTTAQGNGEVSFEFRAAPAPVTDMRLKVPVADATVSSPSAATLAVDRGEGELTAHLVFRRADTIRVTWALTAAVPPAPPVEARIACTTWTLASVTENYISCQTQLRYQVLRGAVDTFVALLPESAHVLSVAGQGAAWSQTPTDGVQRVEVKVNHAVSDAYDISIGYDMPAEGEVIGVPLVRVEGVTRETGYIGVAARGNIEIKPGTTTEGLTRIDAAELPPALYALSPTPILLAFRHGGEERLLALDVDRLDDVAVPDSAIEYADLTTVITEDGLAVTRAAYSTVNSVRQFLRLQIPKEAEVLSAEVAGHVVKPAKDGATGEVLIPLNKSVEVDRRPGAFPVELVYLEHFAPSEGFRDTVSLQAPVTDVLASTLDWKVYLPDSRRLLRSEGDLEPMPGTQRWANKSGDKPMRPTLNVNTETIHPLREHIERFFITDINNPAAGMAGEQRYTGAPLAPDQAGTAPAVSAIAGVLPVHMRLPESGVPYAFERVLAPEGRPLALTLVTYPSGFAKGARAALWLMSLLAGSALAWALKVAQQRGRFVLRFLAAAVCAALCALLVWGFSLPPSQALVAAAIGAAVVLLHALATRDRRRPEPNPAPVIIQEPTPEA